MHGEPSSAAWRLTALLLGASWVVTLAVACGGGSDDDVTGNPASNGAAGAAGSSVRAEAAAMAAVAAAPHTLARAPGQAPGPDAAAVPATRLHPCTDESRRPAQFATVPAHLRAPMVRGDELSDEVLNSPAGHLGAGAAGADPRTDPFEAK